MGARTFTDLRAWQLANDLKLAVYEICARPAVARDLKFCDQIRTAASSVCSNICEGFGRFSHRDFARFVAIARASVLETQNHLRDGCDRRHISAEEFPRLWDLSEHAKASITNLLTYLKNDYSR